MLFATMNPREVKTAFIKEQAFHNFEQDLTEILNQTWLKFYKF